MQPTTAITVRHGSMFSRIPSSSARLCGVGALWTALFLAPIASPQPQSSNTVDSEEIWTSSVGFQTSINLAVGDPTDPNRIFFINHDIGSTAEIRVLNFTAGAWSLNPVPFIDGTGGPGSALSESTAMSDSAMTGLVFHPDLDSGRVFVLYPFLNSSGARGARISELRRDPLFPGRADLSFAGNGEKVLLEVPILALSHYGGRLAFGPDNLLYASIGDGTPGPTAAENALDLSLGVGKLLRLDVNALAPYIPLDNPYVVAPIPNPGPLTPYIYARGFRNPLGVGFDRSTGELWISDVGDQGAAAREELNRCDLAACYARSFGWPCWEGTLDTSATHPAAPCTTAEEDDLITPIVEVIHGAPGMEYIISGIPYRGSTVYALGGSVLYATHSCGGTGAGVSVFAYNPRLNMPEDLTNDLFGGTCGAPTVPPIRQISRVNGIGEDTRGEVLIAGDFGGQGRIVRVTRQSGSPTAPSVGCESLPTNLFGYRPRLYAEGSNSITANQIEFYAWDVARGGACTLFASLAIGTATPAAGQPCIGTAANPLFLVKSGTTTPGGAITLVPDLSTGGFVGALPGTTFHFQALYRESVAGASVNRWSNYCSVTLLM